MQGLSSEFGLFLGLLLFSISIWIRVILNRRKFYRKNDAITGESHSYTRSISNKMIDKILLLMALIVGLYGGGITLYYGFTLLWY